MSTGDFAAVAITLYAAHHVGDYWVQRDVDARRKGEPGRSGALHCAHHVATYLITQAVLVLILIWTIAPAISWVGALAGLVVSGATHYLVDRRAPLARIAGWIPGKAGFLKLGAPREGVRIEAWGDCSTCKGTGRVWDESTAGLCWDCQAGGVLPDGWVGDNPQLATGAWALDQSWHIFWGVFIAALIMVGVG